MCTGKDCPLKETCFRYNAEPDNDWQSWFCETPFVEGECEHYVYNKQKTTKNEKHK